LTSGERNNIPSSILIKKLLNGGFLPKINETDIVLGGLEYGIWKPNLKKIEAQGGNKSTLAKKIGHELLHSVTDNIIYSYQNLKGVVNFNDKYNKDNIRQGYIKPVNLSKSQIEALDNLVRIRNKVVSYVEQNKDRIQKQDRGFGTYDYFIRTNYTESETDLHEFISEVFTNPELINILKEIPTEGKKSNLFKDFVDAVAKILGFTNTSILEDVIAYSEEAFFQQPQITPQQKQQALQLYSQYLDTIFPDSKVKDLGNKQNIEGFKEFIKSSDTSLLQSTGVLSSTANKEVIDRMKEVATKMGVSLQDLSDYLKGNPDIPSTGINAVADLAQKTIAIATGKEGEAITEEVVHIATAMIEQTSPEIITTLISKIDKFKIYKVVLDKYSKLKAYQLPNGKPNIRKIKKEAVDKLIAELIINDGQNPDQFPELRQEENVNQVRSWWTSILDFIKSLYRKANIDLFKDVASQIVAGEIGPVTDVIGDEVFFQVQENPLVDQMYNTILEKDADLVLNDADPKDRHYMYKAIRVLKSVTQKIKEAYKGPERTEEQKKVDEQKRDWGLDGHRYLEKYISNVLIDENGYKRPTPVSGEVITTSLSKDVVDKVERFAVELINSYAPGTRFILEKMVINEKVKGFLASTVDFMAIEPITKADGTSDIKVDILDWKFSSIDKRREEDVPWFKQKEWKEQMGEYTKILYNYGLKPNQLRKARMIPFIVNYENSIPNDRKSPLIAKSVEIGKLDSLKETTLYLLPVPVNSESTGNEKVDSLLSAMRTEYDKLQSQYVPAEQQMAKRLRLSEYSKAIRQLHVKLDFEPLVNVGKTFIKNARLAIDNIKKTKFSDLSKEEIEIKLKELISYQNSADKFSALDVVFLSVFPKEGLSVEDKKVLSSLEDISTFTKRMDNEILELQREFAVEFAQRQGVTTEADKMTALAAEAEVSMLEKNFIEGSKLSPKLIKAASNLVINVRSEVDIILSKAVGEFEKILLPLEKEARAKGKKAFDMIGTVTNGKLKLIKKIDPLFWEAINKAKKVRDKEFLIKNIDIEEYNKLSEEAIKKGMDEINRTQFSSDPEADAGQKAYRIKKLKDSLEINSSSFNGYEDFTFSYLFNRTMKEEGHYSKEYEELRKSDAALDVWNFFTALNQKAKNLGYLEKEGASFFPLIEATTLEKFGQRGDFLAQSSDFFKELYTAQVDEEQSFGVKDKETGKIVKQIPKYFRRSEKAADQLSRDLNKVGVLWMKSLLNYEASKNMENTLLTLQAVEKAKGSLVLDENNNVVFEGGKPRVNEATNKNADILETIVDDSIYGIRESLNSLGNIQLTSFVGKLSKDQEAVEKRVVSSKKALKNADTLVRALAVGLKPLIAVANWAGYNFQALINGGSMYNYKEFMKNHVKVMAGLSTKEKALINIFVPLNEDIAGEKIKELAGKKSFLDFIGSWTFTDVMMSTNSFPEKRLQLTNALSFLDNSMVVDGKIVNIRQHLRAQDRLAKEKLSVPERQELEKSFEKRVLELKDKSALIHIVEVNEDGASIPGVSTQELAKYRTKIVEFGRKLNGQMSESNKAGYRRDSIFSSFMMFKHWIPKQVYVRTGDIKKDVELGEWEYGRARVFFKTWIALCNWNVNKMIQISNGSVEGLALLEELLASKKQDYFEKTGQELQITQEEFNDLIRTQISNQMKEFGVLFGMLGLLVAAKAAEPPEDATDLEKNRYKFWAKMINKISDEISFYYNPASADSITRGSLIPALGLGSKIFKFGEAFSKEVAGYVIDDPEMIDKNYPIKYFLNMIPIGAQLQTEVLPYLNPELAKELGIRVTTQSRQR
jgi:hypothetical protein